MDLDPKRKLYLEKAKKNFEFLTKDFGYTITKEESDHEKDEVTYENKDIDRKIVLSNKYHPYDYGFEIQMYQPSQSTHFTDREIADFKLKEDQDEQHDYLLASADQFLNDFQSIIAGKEWEVEKDSTIKPLKLELENIQKEDVFSPYLRKKKLFAYCIRTTIAVILYYYFWEFDYVRWSLIFYVPINMFSLFSIFGWHRVLKEKIKNIKENNTDDD